ncbi:MAG: hypothetical protein KAQ92_07710 [Candidatus Aenigmarchaeota archaeon]|nr:hypothetical protein [Candidatus Aenigmarchaeota archaeon]
MKQEILEHLGIDDKTLEKIKHIAGQDNPLSKPVSIPKYEVIIDDRISLEQLNHVIQPFFTQLTIVNNRMEELITEKVELSSELNILKVKEEELMEALDISYNLLQEKEEIIANQESTIDEFIRKINRKWWKFWE